RVGGMFGYWPAPRPASRIVARSKPPRRKSRRVMRHPARRAKPPRFATLHVIPRFANFRKSSSPTRSNPVPPKQLNLTGITRHDMGGPGGRCARGQALLTATGADMEERHNR